MSELPRPYGTGGRGRRTAPIAALLAVIAVAIVGCVFIDSLIDGPITPEPSRPAGTGSQVSASAATSMSPSAPGSSARPPAGLGIVGDYRCLTLADATATIERDGYLVGTVSYSIEGGAVDATWLVDTQRPSPVEVAAPGSKIDLLLASPFNVCRPASPAP